ncbi:hypothetical protein [Bauldia sp.]|uniref:hypothetical protein n=1 Tax=Bauldia sp. TaxID=2575872 RepID=UPI003BAA3B52
MRPHPRRHGLLAFCVAFVAASQVGAQTDDGSGAVVSAEELKNRCFLMATFEGDAPDAYEAAVLSGPWQDVVRAFGDAAFLEVLCLGDQDHRAAVYIRDDDGTFQMSSPAYPPRWHVGDDGMLCFGLADDSDRSCGAVVAYPESGAVRLYRDGPVFALVQDDDGNPIYDDIHIHLMAVSP